jgi:hypothetical protein
VLAPHRVSGFGFRLVDVVLTAGLVAGGAERIHRVMTLFLDFVSTTPERGDSAGGHDADYRRVAQLFSGRYERRRRREGLATELAPDRLPAGHGRRGEVDAAASS